MTDFAKIKESLNAMNGSVITNPISCEIVSVQGDSCTVKINGGLEIPDVRLRATLNTESDHLLITPKKGSKALVISVSGELDDLALFKIDKIEKIEYVQGNFKVSVDSTAGKVTVKSGNVSLKSLMSEIHDIITNLKVNTPSGPSVGILPDTVTSLNLFNTHINNLLN